MMEAAPTFNPSRTRALGGDGTQIEGRWIISMIWSGKFLMIRSDRQGRIGFP